jgi:hypothetical protein
MRKTTSAVDRLERALAAEGVRLPRNRLKQLAAALIGCRSDNEYVARSAELYPPVERMGSAVASDGTSLAVLLDPRSRRLYAVDAAALAPDLPRADLIAPSPYGGMVDVEGARDARPTPRQEEKDGHLPLFRFHLTRAATETAGVEVRAATVEEAFARALERDFWSDPRNADFRIDDDNLPDRPYIPDEEDYEVEAPDRG